MACLMWSRVIVGLRPQINGESEHAIFQPGDGVADHGVVLEVHSGLVKEPFALRALDGRQTPLAHGPGPGSKTLDHGFGIEFLRDRQTLAGTRRRADSSPPRTLCC